MTTWQVAPSVQKWCMAKILKKLSLLLLILIVSYLGAHYWIKWRRTLHDDVTKVGRFVSCEPNQIRLIEVERTTPMLQPEKLKFERVDRADPGVPEAILFARSDWRYRSPLTGEAEASTLRRIASSLCELWDPILIQEPKAFQSLTKISFLTETGGRGSLSVSQPGEDRLVIAKFESPSGETKFAKIPDLIYRVVGIPVEDFRTKRVVRMEADNVQRATLIFSGKERFTLERAGAGWVILFGEERIGTGGASAGKFVNRLATLQALDVIEPEFSAQECKKLKARATVNLAGVAGREETVVLDYGRGGDIAACSTGRNMKFRVHRDLVKYIDISPRALMAN